MFILFRGDSLSQEQSQETGPQVFDPSLSAATDASRGSLAVTQVYTYAPQTRYDYQYETNYAITQRTTQIGLLNLKDLFNLGS